MATFVEPSREAVIREEARPVRLLLATDATPAAVAARRVAVDLARRLHAELHIVHVWLSPPGQETSALRHAQQLLFREQLDAVNEGARVEATHLIEGDSITGILDTAEKCSPDLLVMGGRILEPLERWFLGSVSQPVALHAPCPVLVVRSPAAAWPPRHLLVGRHAGADSQRLAAELAELLGADVTAAGSHDAEEADEVTARTLPVLTRSGGHHLLADILVARRARSARGTVLVVPEKEAVRARR